MLKIAIAAAFAAIVATPAAAGDGAWRVGNSQIHVIDSRLDAGTLAGRVKLLAHVERAAAKLCREVQGAATRRACVADTIQQTARGQAGAALALAMRERDGVLVAAR